MPDLNGNFNTEDLCQWVFGRTMGVDYTKATMHHAPVNWEKIRVVIDKAYRLNGQSDEKGSLQVFEHFYSGGRIIYAQERGSYRVHDAWSAVTSEFMGNMYILDVFSNPDDVTEGACWVSCQGKYYWSEG